MRIWLIWTNITFASILGTIAVVAGFVSDSTLQGALQLSNDDMRWISVSFIMMLGITVPLAIYLAERFGYKLLFFIGVAVFLLGSAFTGVSTGFISTLLSRIISGAGAGACFPLSIAIIDDIFPKEKLLAAIALYVGIGFGGGAALGFVLGGYLTQYIGWTASYWFCAIFSVPVLFATWFLHSESEKKENGVFDYGGFGAFVLFISCMLLILNSGKADWNTGGWTSPFIITCAVLSLIGLAALIPIELKHPNPLINFSLFKTKSFLLGCITVFFVGASLYATQLLSVVFLDGDLAYEKHSVGNYTLALGLAMGVSSALAAVLMKKVNIRILTLIGMAFITISCWMNPYVTLYSSHERMEWIWILRAIGNGLAVGPATAFALSETPKALAGAASILIIISRQIGGTIGSLGASVITLERTIFHNARFGSQIDVTAPAFREVGRNLQTHLIQNNGVLPEKAGPLADSIIRSHVMTQSHVTALGDSFHILGWVTLVILVALSLDLILETVKAKRAV